MNDNQENGVEFSYLVEVEALPKAGRTCELSASAEECSAVAKRLGLLHLETLSASLKLARTAGGYISVTGYFDAQLSQACVVTLEPVKENVHESVAMTFMVAPDLRTGKARNRGTETIVSVSDDDPPELVIEDRIDLGELVVEQLVLAMNPYPRADGARFDAQSWGSKGEEEAESPANPFAALEKLKKTHPH